MRSEQFVIYPTVTHIHPRFKGQLCVAIISAEGASY